MGRPSGAGGPPGQPAGAPAVAAGRPGGPGGPPGGFAPPKGPSLLSLLKPYRGWIALLVVFTIASNALNLVTPRLIARGIDGAANPDFNLTGLAIEFTLIALVAFVFTYLQSLVQTYAAERAASDLRLRLIAKIAEQDFACVQTQTPAKLLTNLSSDVDGVKSFIAQAFATIISSLFLIVGASVLLLLIDWKLALVVLLVVPAVALTFRMVSKRVRPLFMQAMGAIDWLNKVISESILGSSLIRLVNSQAREYDKFFAANEASREIGMKLLRLFALMIPIVIFATNLATLAIVALGGHFVISGAMSLGNFAAFNSYLAILIFPVILIGFMSNVINQARASYARISVVLAAPPAKPGGTLDVAIRGDIDVEHVTVRYGQKKALDDVSFAIRAGTRTAIIGPTAAGKTQLLYALTGLIEPQEGVVRYDGRPLADYDKNALHRQVGLVFQDSVTFNLTLRENIAFSNAVDDASLRKAIETAELDEFIAGLPQGLDTVVSERGTSLSGGQKQRIMLARALALEPRVLLLDDFTARVDVRTEKKILDNVRQNYPGITLVSVTQKVAPVEDYDKIILLMEGSVLASGTHAEMMAVSPEYAQIKLSQQSTDDYGLQAQHG
ncbi:MAG: ABC transporter ATP-binding protein [Bauldia sp.]